MNLGSRSSIQYAQCPENQAFLTTWYTHMRIRVGDKLFCSENILHIRNWWFLTELNTYIRHLHFISHQFIFSNDKFFKNCVSIRKTVLMFFKTFSDLQHFWFKFEKYAFLVFLDKYVPFYFLFFCKLELFCAGICFSLWSDHNSFFETLIHGRFLSGSCEFIF